MISPTPAAPPPGRSSTTPSRRCGARTGRPRRPRSHADPRRRARRSRSRSISTTGHWPASPGLIIALACSGFVFAQMRPDLLFADTTPSGGDMGAHVWGPAFLRDHLLTQGRLSGLDARLVRRFPRLSLLHDRAVACDRGRQRRASGRCSVIPLVLLVNIGAFVLTQRVRSTSTGVRVAVGLGVATPAVGARTGSRSSSSASRGSCCSRCRRVGVRPSGPGARAGAVAASDRCAVLPVRHELHDLRRKHRLHPRRRVRILDQLEPLLVGLRCGRSGHGDRPMAGGRLPS